MKYEILMVLTSHDQLGDTGLKTGFWLEEGAAPYFYPGGHGPMWDFAEDRVSVALFESFYSSGKPIASVCHSPGVLRHVKYKSEPVKGKQVTGFTNGEEQEMKLTNVVPFLVEDELLQFGAIFKKKADWQPFAITDGRLITGQNPASSISKAQAPLTFMAAEKAA